MPIRRKEILLPTTNDTEKVEQNSLEKDKNNAVCSSRYILAFIHWLLTLHGIVDATALGEEKNARQPYFTPPPFLSEWRFPGAFVEMRLQQRL